VNVAHDSSVYLLNNWLAPYASNSIQILTLSFMALFLSNILLANGCGSTFDSCDTQAQWLGMAKEQRWAILRLNAWQCRLFT